MELSWPDEYSLPDLALQVQRYARKVGTVGVQAEIRTGHLKNTRHKHYLLHQFARFRGDSL
jgi:hypothetical protein